MAEMPQSSREPEASESHDDSHHESQTIPLRAAQIEESPPPEVISLESSIREARAEQKKAKLAKELADIRADTKRLNEEAAITDARRMQPAPLSPDQNTPLPSTLSADPPLTRKRSASEFQADLRVSVPSIKEYKGESLAEHEEFVYHCRKVFLASRSRFDCDSAKVVYASTHLVGKPMQAWRQYEQEHGEDTATWEEFVNYLRDLIQHPAVRKTANSIRYHTAKQLDGQSVDEFATYLNRLELELEGGVPKEEHRVSRLLAGLQPSLREEIQKLPNYPNTREELIHMAKLFDESGKQRRGRNARGSHHKSYQSRSDSNSSQKNHPSHKPHRGARGGRGPRGSHGKRGGYAGKPKGEVTCYNCNEKGHIKPDCPKLQERVKEVA